METSIKDVRDVPVSSFLAISIIIVFSLYATTALKTIPCGKDLLANFTSNFIHIDPYHLIANLYALYALSRVEVSLGPKKFFILVLFLLFVNTLFEGAVHKMIPDIPCSIGFSGVLFGMMTWELVTNKGLDFYVATSIGAMVILPSIQNQKASLMGHLVGAVSGIIGGLLWSKISHTIKW